MSSGSLVTIAETPEFIRRIDKLMDDDERAALILYLAENPTAADLIPGTGGVRNCGGVWKVAASAEALTAFAKNERTDISGADRNSFRQLTKLLVDTYGRRRS